jgi:hypothetical protein
VEGRKGTVIVCCGAGKNCANDIKPELVEFKMGGRVMDSAERQKDWMNNKCMRLMSEFADGDVKKGQQFAYLGVTMKKKGTFLISHVIVS